MIFFSFRLDQEKVSVLRIAEPIKHYWAVKNSLDFQKLLDTSEYKEQHRFEMVKWSMEVRAENYGYFPVEALRMANGNLFSNYFLDGAICVICY